MSLKLGPMNVPPMRNKEVPLGSINRQIAVANAAGPTAPPTTFSVSFAGEHSEYLPGQVVSPGQYWEHGVEGPVTGLLVNAGPSTLTVYIDQTPEPLGAPAAREASPEAASGRSEG